MNYGCKDKEFPYALCFQPLRFNVNYEKEAAIPRKNDRLIDYHYTPVFKLYHLYVPTNDCLEFLQ